MTGIHATALVWGVQGGLSELQGTWAHPKIAIHVGMWISLKLLDKRIKKNALLENLD